MNELRFATETAADDETIDCSWSSIIRGIERYAAYQPAGLAHDLYQLADLLEGIRRLTDES